MTLCNPMDYTHQVSLSFTVSWSLLKLMSIELCCHPTISSSVTRFSSCPQSFPASGSFPMSQLFASGGQSIGSSALASVLPFGCSDMVSSHTVKWTVSAVTVGNKKPRGPSAHVSLSHHAPDMYSACSETQFFLFPGHPLGWGSANSLPKGQIIKMFGLLVVRSLLQQLSSGAVAQKQT